MTGHFLSDFSPEKQNDEQSSSENAKRRKYG